MELRPLRALVEVVRQGGFSQAAKTIHATPHGQQGDQAAGRRAWHALAGPPGHPPRLTEAGEIVYRRALSMLAERDDLRAELDALRGLQRGVLRLGLPRLAAARCSRPCSRAFAAVIRASKSAWWNTAAGGSKNW